MNILAIGAHPDDIETSCGGTLAKYAKMGHKVFTATATNGNVGSATLPMDEIAKIRKEEARRASWVKDNLLAKPKVFKWTKEYFMDRYSSTPVMPYEVERIHFEKRGEYSTEGKFMHMFTCTVGSKVTVRSITNPELTADCDKFQTLVIPASFGDYEIINEAGGRVTCVIQRWKKG